MPTGMSGLFRNTYGARAERECNMKRLERAMFLQSGFVDLAVITVIFMVMGFVMLVNL